MTRDRAILLIALVLVGALVAWIASRTEWADTEVPMPPRGEARTNPFYAAQRFAETLGARASWDRVFTTPPPDAVLVLSTWQWNLSDTRRRALEQWTENGGRLVVDQGLFDSDELFATWSGISRSFQIPEDGEGPTRQRSPCRTFRQEPAPPASRGVRGSYRMCDVGTFSSLTTERDIIWALRDDTGLQAVRVPVGDGSVTVINATPFLYRSLFDGSHGRLFVDATGLRPGDEVRFLSEDDHLSLPALVWRFGAPAVLLGLAFVALALWRGGGRFGPPAAPPESARRSLAEQIRGTGQFAMRHGGGAALYTAAARALDDTARTHVPGYASLSPDERGAALAALTGVDAAALADAMVAWRPRRPQTLPATIALLETTRRALITDATGARPPSHREERRPAHGTD